MTPEQELEEGRANRVALWQFYLVVNPPVNLVEATVGKGDMISLDRGRVELGGGRRFYFTFHFVAERKLTLLTANAENFHKMHVVPGHVTLVSAWLDDMPTSHMAAGKVSARTETRYSDDPEHPRNKETGRGA